MSNSIKSFTVTGDASTFGKGGSRRRASRKRGGASEENCANGQCPIITKQSGGLPPAMTGQVATAGVVPLGVKTPVTPFIAPTNLKSTPTQGAFIHDLRAMDPPQMGGAHEKKIHVELKKSSTPKKVHLNPKKTTSTKSETSGTKTRKARKVTLGVTTMHNRVTRAKKIHKKVKEMPLDDLRKELVKRGLIKETSKAPESILRQIAADAQIVSGKGL